MINVKKLPIVVLQALRESRGLKFDDDSEDSAFKILYPFQIFECYIKNQRLSVESYSRLYDAAVGIHKAGGR